MRENLIDLWVGVIISSPFVLLSAAIEGLLRLTGREVLPWEVLIAEGTVCLLCSTAMLMRRHRLAESVRSSRNA